VIRSGIFPPQAARFAAMARAGILTRRIVAQHGEQNPACPNRFINKILVSAANRGVFFGVRFAYALIPQVEEQSEPIPGTSAVG
jgi:hypothetical protein